MIDLDPTLAHQLFDVAIGEPVSEMPAHGEYIAHYNQHRPHQSLGQRAPTAGEVVAFGSGQPIRRHAGCHGLINEYRTAA